MKGYGEMKSPSKGNRSISGRVEEDDLADSVSQAQRESICSKKVLKEKCRAREGIDEVETERKKESENEEGRKDSSIDLTVDNPYVVASPSISSSAVAAINVARHRDNTMKRKRIDGETYKVKGSHEGLDKEMEKEDEYEDEDGQDHQILGDELKGGADDIWSESIELERGRLRCLIELGHLDSVVDQSLGMIQRVPELESALIPFGIEASWKLMKWGELDGFLQRIDTTSASDSPCHPQLLSLSSSVSASLSNMLDSSRAKDNDSSTSIKSFRSNVSILPEDRFQVRAEDLD